MASAGFGDVEAFRRFHENPIIEFYPVNTSPFAFLGSRNIAKSFPIRTATAGLVKVAVLMIITKIALLSFSPEIF